jgi:hypothetical protein
MRRPKRPFSVLGIARATMKIRRCTPVAQGDIGVTTFIAYAFPAVFGMNVL